MNINLSSESILDESILVYPNPTHDEITVQNDSSPIQQVRWYDLQGKLIVEKNYSNHSTIHTKIPSNAKGLYILQVITEQGVITKKIEKFYGLFKVRYIFKFATLK